MNFIRTAINHRKITLFILGILLMMGMFYYYFLPRQEYPEINAPVAMITMVYPGASPDDVDVMVTTEIEKQLKEIEGYDYSFSYSYNSMSVVFIRLIYGTDTEKAWKDLRDRLDDLQTTLPKEVKQAQIDTDLVETAGILISMSGSKYTSEELAGYSNSLREELSKVNGISKFEVVGKQSKQLLVKVDYKKLNQYNLSLNDLSQLLQLQNVEIPAGQIQSNQIKVNLKAEGTFKNIRNIENLVVGISKENGSVLRLKDIASVAMDSGDSSFKIQQNSEPAVLLSGYFQKDRNVVLVGKEVNKILDAYKKQLPKDIKFDLVLFQPATVKASLDSFNLNLLEGMFFVVLVVLIGMGLRNALIVSTAIPSSIILTFLMMKFFKIDLHQISVASLIVALGMLVDNAIVVIDSIQVKLDEGLERLDACVNGTREIAIPVFTSTLTTVAAFLPLLVLPSIAGEYIVSLPAIIIISLCFSYLVAIFITPCMAFLLLKPSRKDKMKKELWLRRFFQFVLKKAMAHKLIFSGTLLILAVLAAVVGLNTGLKFFPYADTDLLYIDLHSERNNDFDQTAKLVEEVETLLKTQKAVIGYTSAVGGGLPKFYNTLPIIAPSNQEAQIMIKMDLNEFGRGKRYKELGVFTSEFQKLLNSKLVGGTAHIKQLEQGEPIGAPIRIRVTGDDLDHIGNVSQQLLSILEDIPGTTNLSSDFEHRAYEYRVALDDNEANFSGISSYDLQNEISIALRGRESGVIRLLDEEYPIILKSDIIATSSLENFFVKSMLTGNKVPIKTVASIGLVSEYGVIKKYNGERTVQVFSDILPGFSSLEIKREFIQKFNENPATDVSIIFDGEEEKIKENFGNIGASGIFAIFFVYIILLVQFKSFTQPLIILLTIPLSAIGSFLGLYLTHQDLSFLSMLGIVSLLGIVVNNAIILMDYINVERASGKAVKLACMDAVSKRFRPIMLTTTTTVIGLVPLVFSGSKLFTPMSIALMSGLMVSTLLTLVVIPTVYEWSHKDK